MQYSMSMHMIHVPTVELPPSLVKVTKFYSFNMQWLDNMLIYDGMKMVMLLYLHMFMCSKHDKIHDLSLNRARSK